MADCPPVTGSLSEVTSSGNVTTATVTELFIYPVKSTRGIARARVRIAATGFEWDRQWMIIDHKGTFLSQRTHPQLAQIVPQLTSDALILRHAKHAPLTVNSVKFIVGETVKPVNERNLKQCADMVAQCFASNDYKEGRTAFMEKRKPAFTGT